MSCIRQSRPERLMFTDTCLYAILTSCIFTEGPFLVHVSQTRSAQTAATVQSGLSLKVRERLCRQSDLFRLMVLPPVPHTSVQRKVNIYPALLKRRFKRQQA